MRRTITALALTSLLICGGIARAQTSPQLTARQGPQQSTIVTWQQPTTAYMCLYGRVLLTCGTFSPGPARVVVNGRSPVALASVLHRGDTIKLVNVASGETAITTVLPAPLYLPLIRRS